MATIKRSSLVGELRRIRRQSKGAEDKHYLSWAIRAVECQLAAPVQKDVAELEQLFKLEDPRK